MTEVPCPARAPLLQSKTRKVTEPGRCRREASWVHSPARRLIHAGPLLSIRVFSNPMLLWGIRFELALTAVVVCVPPLRDVLGTAVLAPWMIAFVVLFPFIIRGVRRGVSVGAAAPGRLAGRGCGGFRRWRERGPAMSRSRR
ncbi:cation transporting ATPase C-terminal domain-containing protein [Nocardia kruczakiae]|uniref:cation transporting ATPase C-terminal domain-containing protein n=1 Tax=Nocardia kruczakiae TaxID=261477 RepID=UPI00350E46A0